MKPAAFVTTPTSQFSRSFAPDTRSISSLRNGFVTPMHVTSRRCRQVDAAALWAMKIGIIFSTVTGNTDEMANIIKTELGDEADDPKEISDIKAAEMAAYDALVIGAPTWNTGADTERTGTTWDEFIYDDLENISLSGKPVAVFGLGDGVGYAENFCDGIEEIHDAFQKAGGNMIGYTSTDGVDFDESKSVRDGKFLGLPLDNTNYDGEVAVKISDWCAQIMKEAGLPASV